MLPIRELSPSPIPFFFFFYFSRCKVDAHLGRHDHSPPNHKTPSTVYSAYAETQLTIRCNETKYCEPPGRFQDQPSIISAAACRAADLTLTPKRETAKVPAAKAAADFAPKGYNCSARSLSEAPHAAPAWEVGAFSFHRTWVAVRAELNASSGFQDEVSFTLRNTATDSDWPYADQERTCWAATDIGRPMDGKAMAGCGGPQASNRMFAFDPDTGLLRLSSDWNCDGKDAAHAYGGSPFSCT
jgi:hypothetical protein